MGRAAFFWEDRWINGQSVEMITPLLLDFVDVRTRRLHTVEQGVALNSWAREFTTGLSIPAIMQYLRLWNETATI
jgi:hypothetical protein